MTSGQSTRAERRRIGRHRRFSQSHEPSTPATAVPMRIEHTVTQMPEAERLRVVVRDARTGAIGASRQLLDSIVC